MSRDDAFGRALAIAEESSSAAIVDKALVPDYFPTDKQRQALQVVLDENERHGHNGYILPGRFGLLMWPNGPHDRVSNIGGYGAASGVGMWRSAGGFLGKLKKRGYLTRVYDRAARSTYRLSPMGRIALSAPKLPAPTARQWKALAGCYTAQETYGSFIPQEVQASSRDVTLLTRKGWLVDTGWTHVTNEQALVTADSVANWIHLMPARVVSGWLEDASV